MAAERDVLPPVQGRVRLDEVALAGLKLDREHLAQVALGEEPLDRPVDLERVRRRHELAHQARGPAGGVEHAPALGGVHRHPRLAQDVLARGEGGQRHLAVHVRPRADAHGIDVFGLDDLPPVAVDAGDAEFAGHALTGLLGSIGHRDELDAALGLELRDVVKTRIVAGADEAYADRLVVCHGPAL